MDYVTAARSGRGSARLCCTERTTAAGLNALKAAKGTVSRDQAPILFAKTFFGRFTTGRRLLQRRLLSETGYTKARLLLTRTGYFDQLAQQLSKEYKS